MFPSVTSIGSCLNGWWGPIQLPPFDPASQAALVRSSVDINFNDFLYLPRARAVCREFESARGRIFPWKNHSSQFI